MYIITYNLLYLLIQFLVTPIIYIYIYIYSYNRAIIIHSSRNPGWHPEIIFRPGYKTESSNICKMFQKTSTSDDTWHFDQLWKLIDLLWNSWICCRRKLHWTPLIIFRHESNASTTTTAYFLTYDYFVTRAGYFITRAGALLHYPGRRGTLIPGGVY